MSEIVIYTDGSCYPNPGPGGWAFIIGETEVTGGEKQTTNNRMEIIAVVRGLSYVKEPSNLKIHSDSQYVVNGIGCWVDGKPTKKGWMVKWKKQGWTRPEGEPLKNLDLWKELDSLVKTHKSVEMVWVRGHNDNTLNERCDELALKARIAAT